MTRSSSREPSSALVLAIDIGTSSFVPRCSTHADGGSSARRRRRRIRCGSRRMAARSFHRKRCDEHSSMPGENAVYRGDRTLRLRPIIAVGTSCFWHSLLGADESGRALTADLHVGGFAVSRRRGAVAQGIFRARSTRADRVRVAVVVLAGETAVVATDATEIFCARGALDVTCRMVAA